MLVRELDLDLDAFEGPFDLLLTLVLREELEPRDVDVADVVVTFVERLALGTSGAGAAPPGDGGFAAVASSALGTGGAGAAPPGDGGFAAVASSAERGQLDLDACGEFLILVGALLELKARGLFGEEQVDLGDLDPEEAAEELARRLEEFRRVKEAAGWLSDRLEAERDRFFRLGPAPLAPRPDRRIAPQQPEALVSALRALATEPPEVSLAHMGLRFPPVAQFVERFRALLRRRRRFDFEQEVAGLERIEQAVAFLALLELRKAGEIRIEQAAPFAPIRIARPQEETAGARLQSGFGSDSQPVEEGDSSWNVRSA